MYLIFYADELLVNSLISEIGTPSTIPEYLWRRISKPGWFMTGYYSILDRYSSTEVLR